MRLPPPIVRLSTRRRSRPRGLIFRACAAALRGFAWSLPAFLLLWAFGALWYDFPFIPGWIACAWMGGLVYLLFRLRRLGSRLTAVGVSVAVIWLWWRTLTPTHDRSWELNVAQTGWAQTQPDGDTVVLHNVRHSRYRSGTDYTPVWETRTVKLSSITTIDLALCHQDAAPEEHPIVSFQFSDAPPVCFSIEPRLEKGEEYSAPGSFFRRHELVYVMADESDALRVRTHYQQEGQVRLYRLNITPEQARLRFAEYLTTLNELHSQPRWHNALTTGWHTSLRTQRNGSSNVPWDWRLMSISRADELLFSRGRLVTDGLSFQDLKARALINDAALKAGDSPDFPRLIRTGRPGFSILPPPAPAAPPPAGMASPSKSIVPAPVSAPEPPSEGVISSPSPF